MTLVNGRLRHHETPAFGSSSHLAGLLLAARTVDSEKTSILNIAVPVIDDSVDVDLIEKTTNDLGLELNLAPKGMLNATQGNKVDCILDRGAFGWEPSLYILAHNPLELVDRTHQFISTMEGFA